MKNIQRTALAIAAALAMSADIHAQTLYWKPNANNTAGSAVWDESVAAWAEPQANGNAPNDASPRVNWVDGSDALFTLNNGNNIATLNKSINAGLFAIGGNNVTDYTFNGLGSLNVFGAATIGRPATFNLGSISFAGSVTSTQATTFNAETLTMSGPAYLNGNPTIFNAKNLTISEPLTLAGGTMTFNNTNSLALSSPALIYATTTFNCGIDLPGDLDFANQSAASIFGSITGGNVFRKFGGNALTLSNAVNNLSALWIDSQRVNAYGGGNALGGAGSDLILGHYEATGNTYPSLSLFTMKDRAVTDWNARDLVANGYAELAGESGAFTNAINFHGTLRRENKGAISIPTTGVPNTTRIHIADLEGVANERGILPLWISSDGEFLYTNSFGNLMQTPTTRHMNPMDDPTNVIWPDNARTFTDGETAYGIKFQHNGFVVPDGVTVTNVSGGFAMKDGSILGGGTFELGDAGAVFSVRNERRVEPRINTTGGLAVVGGGTLVVTNLSWRGGTAIWSGSLKAILDGDTDVPGNFLAMPYYSGRSYFRKEGAGALTFDGHDSIFNSFEFNEGPALTIRNSTLEVGYGLQLNADGMSVLVANSVLKNANDKHQTGIGKNDINVTIADSVLDGWSGFFLGVNGGSGNTMVVDNTVATNRTLTRLRAHQLTHENKPGLAVGVGVNSSNNTLRIINGAQWYDYVSVNDGNNGVGLGENASGNLLEVIGGEGVVTILMKGNPNAIGGVLGSPNNVNLGIGADGNKVIIDGKGFPGSAWLQCGGEAGFMVGHNGASYNTLILRDGAIMTQGSLLVGRGSKQNYAEFTGKGTDWTGTGGGSNFSLGVPLSTYTNNVLAKQFDAVSNLVYIADGASISAVNKNNTGIGSHTAAGDRESNAGNSIDNRVWVGANGYWDIGNETQIGRVFGAGHTASGNELLISGSGATVRANHIVIGTEAGDATYGYSQAVGNKLIVEDGGYLYCTYISLGNRTSASAEGDSYNNRVIVRDNSHLYIHEQLRLGASNDFNPHDNDIEVTSGGMLTAHSIRLNSPDNNIVRIFDGGIWQLRNRLPTFDSRAGVSRYPGFFTLENAVISITNNAEVRIRDNWTQSNFTNVTWKGNNAFRMNNITLDNSSGVNNYNSYVFDPGVSTNYFRLEMVNGSTVYRTNASDLNPLVIGSAVGSGASMLCSNTTASVALPFEMNGELAIVNSTLTVSKPATIAGDITLSNGSIFFDAGADMTGAIIIDSDAVDPENLPTITGLLNLGAGFIIRATGEITDGKPIARINDPATGSIKFDKSNLPPNYSYRYGTEGEGVVSAHYYDPTTIIIIR